MLDLFKVLPNDEVTLISSFCDYGLHQKGNGSYVIQHDKRVHGSFDKVPSQIKRWFITNLAVPQNEILRAIPLGVYRLGAPLIETVMQERWGGNSTDSGWMYINWGNTSDERKNLKNWWFHHQHPWVTFHMNRDLSPLNYLRHIAAHRFVLSPPGCGIDCYRNLEAIYLGTIPIIKDSVTMRNVYSDLPVLFVDDLYDIDKIMLEEAYDKIKRKDYNYQKLDISYWRRLINS